MGKQLFNLKTGGKIAAMCKLSLFVSEKQFDINSDQIYFDNFFHNFEIFLYVEPKRRLKNLKIFKISSS